MKRLLKAVGRLLYYIATCPMLTATIGYEICKYGLDGAKARQARILREAKRKMKYFNMLRDVDRAIASKLRDVAKAVDEHDRYLYLTSYHKLTDLCDRRRILKDVLDDGI